ncbi:MAG: TonB-dependent receptor [Pseudidiomarina maritima]|nr:TonB-dependent receptor [Pseudidiomarina maritima]
MNKTALYCAMAGLTVVAQPAQALQQDVNSSNADIEVITVVAHRQPRQLSEVAGTVSVLSEEQMQRDLVLNATDLVRYQVGVEIDDGGSRFGDSGFRIRGIGGNRTAIVIDQVPVADQFSVGAFSDTGRGLMELGLASRVEILRGPASTLYGSKALGGVVAISLLEADDVLYGSNYGTRLQLGYNSDSHRAKVMAAQAYANQSGSLLLAAALQYGQELRSEGVAASDRDLQHHRQQGLLARLATDASWGRWQFTLDALQESRDTNIRSGLGEGRQASTTYLAGDDARQQWRALIDLEMEPQAWADTGQWRLYYQYSDTEQDSHEERMLLPEPLLIQRDFEFTQRTAGIGADLAKQFDSVGFAHRLGYGFEWISSSLVDERDALQTNLTTQVSTNVLLGETFPLRDFPRSRVTEFGMYVHDEIELWEQGPVISPGVRYENYRLRARHDALFELRYPQSTVTDLTESAWLPKFGVVWPVSEQVEWFGQYARGYRAPPFSDVNVGLYYPQFRVLAIANPDLKAERGYTFETGLRARLTGHSITAAVFHNRYSDFIESRASLGFDPVRQLLIFQSINRDKVVIEGAEFEWQADWNRQWSSQLALAYSRGEDRETGLAIADVAPPQAILEVSYSNADWESRLVLTAVRGQRELQDADGSLLFSAPGYATVDWVNRWFVADDLSIGAGLFNLTDRRYWKNSRVSGYPIADPSLEVLAEAGLHAGITVNYQF